MCPRWKEEEGTRTSREQLWERTGHGPPGWPLPPTQQPLCCPPQTSRTSSSKSLGLCNCWYCVGTAGPWFGDGSSWKGSVRGTEQPVRPTHRCPIQPSTPTLERDPPDPTWLPWGPSTLGNQGHLSWGATAEGTTETGATRRQALQRGTVQSFWGGGSVPSTDGTKAASSF